MEEQDPSRPRCHGQRPREAKGNHQTSPKTSPQLPNPRRSPQRRERKQHCRIALLAMARRAGRLSAVHRGLCRS
ncbi:hypothetical protein MRX96_004698 [Rhipicephalus microplus]